MKNQRWRGAAAVEEGGRIIAITFMSLLLPLSFLLLARLSAARYFSAAAVSGHEISFLTSVFVRRNTTLILSFLVIAVAIETLLRGDKRRRLWVALVMISLMQICLSLGIHGGAAVAEIRGSAAGNLVLARRAVFVLGLHEVTIFWRRSVVAPVVDDTVGGFGLVEEVILAAGFGNLWWRRLKDEAEALVEVAGAVGLLLYYLTAVIGGVRVIKGFAWAARWICGRRRWRGKKEVNAAVNSPV
ncbi:uncharacterized protein LOC125217595 [Salvia hispanica]|uniref:uncharacterized protein LOC125217595 n=1 Tax=Salvia hispanica TaxID=49212 RepID=UPI0020098C55|nr:uncharacterized protein LOC125217595 [Salvia hispanica]